MKKIIKEMWELHNRLIPNYEGKIFIALTGGLDSRVLAGIVGARREIDLGYYYYYPDSIGNVPHVKELVKILPYKDFQFIEVESHDRTKQSVSPLKLLMKYYDLKEYKVVVNLYGDVVTGMFKRLVRNRGFYIKENFFDYNLMRHEEDFGSASLPLWTPEFVGYMYNIPRRYRLFQYAYIRMIKEYLPHLYDVPRCYERGSGNPTRLDYYMIRRLIDKGLKI